MSQMENEEMIMIEWLCSTSGCRELDNGDRAVQQ